MTVIFVIPNALINYEEPSNVQQGKAAACIFLQFTNVTILKFYCYMYDLYFLWAINFIENVLLQSKYFCGHIDTTVYLLLIHVNNYLTLCNVHTSTFSL